MKTFTETLATFGRFLVNKAVAILLTLFLLDAYRNLPQPIYNPETGELLVKGAPYGELLYLTILILGSTVVAPFVRLLVFPEASTYAEQGKLREDLSWPKPPSGLLHYWFATFISYALTIACAASLSH